jgi:eukaryotic-like serine/threonine-protein kinase
MSINRLPFLIISGVAVVCAAALAVPAWNHLHETPPTPPAALRLALPPLDDVSLGAGADHPFGLALAPDGRRVAFPGSRGGTTQLWVRDITTGQTAALPGTDDGVLPFWSPDGRQLGFFSAGRMKALSLADGQTTDLADAPAPRGAVWHANGDIIFAPKTDDGLYRRRASDTNVEPFTAIDTAHGETSHRFPSLTNQGTHIIFLVRAGEPSRSGIWITPIDAPNRRTRLTRADASAIAAGDWIVFASDHALLAQQLTGLEGDAAPSLTGRPVLLGTPVGQSPLNQLSATSGGHVLIFGAPQAQLRDLRWVERNGAQSTFAAQVDARDLRIAPSGGTIAVAQLDPQLGTLDVWTYEGGRPLPRPISQALDADEFVAWSADAARLAWVQSRRTIMIRGAQAQFPEQVLRKFGAPVRLWDWSVDGERFVIGQTTAGTKDDLFVASFKSELSTPYASTAFNETHAAIAPDGRWMAYASDESGQPEIYVDSFPTPGHRGRVTSGGGIEPRWARQTSELFFRRGSEVHVVSLSLTGERPEALGTTRLFDVGGEIRAFDVTPDGQRFLVNVPAPAAKPRPTTVVVHWQSLLVSGTGGPQ